MKQISFKFFLGTSLLFSNISSPIFSSTLSEIQTHLQLSSRSEQLEKLDQLPVSDKSLQRMYLVRHGESTANVYFEWDGKKMRYVSGHSPEIPLTETGKTQILALAKKLAERFPTETRLIITSSTALRTQQTAKILFEELSKTHSNIRLTEEIYEGLNERHLGKWEGLLKDENYTKAESTWKNMPAAEKFFFPEVEEGEPYSEVAHRAWSALSEIYNRYAGNTIIAVTSFHTINATAIEMNHLSSLLSTAPGSNLPKLDLHNGDLVLLETPTNLDFENTQVVSHITQDK